MNEPRTVYAEKISDDLYILSPYKTTTNKRRPINYYSTPEDLLNEVNRRGLEVEWLEI